jgi:hypothetical protein
MQLRWNCHDLDLGEWVSPRSSGFQIARLEVLAAGWRRREQQETTPQRRMQLLRWNCHDLDLGEWVSPRSSGF